MVAKLAIIIPAYNEGSVLGATIASIRAISRQIPTTFDIIVVNDGSTDTTATIARTEADVLITHRKNCGLGAALATGIAYAKRHDYSYLITFDADGQHLPKDILVAFDALTQGADIVIGSRFLGSAQAMPFLRRLLLKGSNWVTYLFFGVWTTDSQSGFRALGPRAITELRLVSNRMEVSSEFFGEIRRLKLKYKEIPIHVRYTAYSLAKGQQNTASVQILVKLLYLLGR